MRKALQWHERLECFKESIIKALQETEHCGKLPEANLWPIQITLLAEACTDLAHNHDLHTFLYTLNETEKGKIAIETMKLKVCSCCETELHHAILRRQILHLVCNCWTVKLKSIYKFHRGGLNDSTVPKYAHYNAYQEGFALFTITMPDLLL